MAFDTKNLSVNINLTSIPIYKQVTQLDDNDLQSVQYQ